MRSEENAPKSGEPTIRFSFTTRLQLTSDLTLEHPPYSPDLAADDLCLFPGLKSTCCVASDAIKNATEDLKRLSQNGFQ